MELILRNYSRAWTYSVFLLLFCLLFVSLVHSTDNLKNIRVYEGIPPASVLLTLPARHGFRYLLVYSSSSGTSLFHVSPQGILSTKATLDHEDERGFAFDLVIVCRENNRTEGGIATSVRITVLDENDNTPTFAKDLYTASIPENSLVGSYVQGLEGVHAQDQDSGLNSVYSYSITAGNEAGLFAVEMNDLAGVKFLLLKTTAPIDREKTASFVLTVQVKDNGTKYLSSQTQIRINVGDENDCYPLFDPPIYSLSVNENTAVGTSVLHVKAYDDDHGRNAEVYYYFTKDHDFFAINPHTGIVSIASQLSFEQGNYFELNVVAVDRGSITRHNSSTLVKIRIKDVIDYPPEQFPKPPKNPTFEPANYYVKVREDLPVNGAIVHVRTAADGEYHRPHFYFELFPSSLRDTFYINPKSGIISLLTSLDFESQNSYVLKILAKDYNNRQFIAETGVVIELTDVDENLYPPVFGSNTIVKTMPPNALKNTVIERIKASDKDRGQNGQVRYSVIGGNGAGRFFLDEERGLLKSLGSQNIKADSRYDLHIQARDGAKFPRFAHLYMLVVSSSSHQKRPYFLSPSQEASLQENSDAGSFVAAVKAEFKGELQREDRNIFQYSIIAGNEEDKFNIDKETGIIFTTSKLDRERKAEYALDVMAKIQEAADNMSTLAQVVVMVTDENDNDPKFIQDSFEVQIKENQGSVENLLCLIATDADTGSNANLTYTIVDGNSYGLFSLHPSLGILSVRDSFDFEKVKQHDLRVRVTDGGIPTRSSIAKVKIIVQNANDAPVFVQKSYEVVVSDSTNVGTIIAVLDITDEDRDNGRSSVNVEEDAQPGNTLSIINATDEDTGQRGQFLCTIDDIDADEMDTFNFRTVKQGCALTLSNYLEYSHRSEYSFKVRATDQADSAIRRSTTATVIVRVRDGNNNYPTFPQSSYWIALPEDTAIGTVVLTVKTTDLDTGSNADITYESSARDEFPVHPDDGIIKLQQRATPNKKYTFAITASDKGTPSKSSVVKVFVSVHSVSDTPPAFRKLNYIKEIPEDFRVNSEVMKLEAKNGAGSGMKLSYYLVGGDPKMQFRIDSNTGWLSLRHALDYENIQEYRLVVRAVQQGWTVIMPELPAETIVTIKVLDVNDNAPRFAVPQDPFVTSVDQFLASGSIVTKLTAYDRDSTTNAIVTYSIENDANVPFIIERDTGVIRTDKVLQYSEKKSHSFVVKATDATFPYNLGQVSVKVYVSNVSPPIKFQKKHFDLIIPENSHVGSFWLKLHPQYSGQSTLKYSITRGNKGGAFCLDVTGVVRVRRKLDREKKEKYVLKITVKKGSLISEGPIVVVRLSDVNDNAPKFQKPVHKLSVMENAKGGHEIGTIRARDPDKGENSRLIYSIVNYENTQSDRRFTIDLNTGILRATTTLDRENLDQHVLTIRAEDAGSPRRSRLTHVIVVVRDINDHAPTFSSKQCVVNIPLNSRLNAPIFTAHAFDADRDANGFITYSIVTGNSERFFRINPHSGDLTLVKLLEDLKSFQLKVKARDSGRPNKDSSTNLKINVYPLRGPPRFPSSSFVGQVVENVPGSKTVLKIKAASMEPIMYSIISGNENNKFHLNPGSGLLTTVTSLDHEEKSQYVINVMATDLTNRMSKVSAIVNVVNVNDNVPKFLNIKGGFVEGSALVDVSIESVVMSIKADDADKTDKLMYAIDDLQAAKYLQVTADGMVKTRKVLRGISTPVVFKVGVRDNGRPPNTAFAMARLVLLKYQLQQGEHQARISESSPIGSQVTTLRPAIHINNGQYSIVSPSDSHFKIDSDSGIVTIKTALDYETRQTHRFIAQVQNVLDDIDYTNIDVLVHVLDANDNKPSFTMKTTSGLFLSYVNVNPNPNTRVYRLTATDADSELNGAVRYRMVNDRDGLFRIDPVSGTITTRSTNLLLLAWYNLTVAAYDLGKPSLVTKALINVKTGEYPPLFDKNDYVFYVDENTLRGIAVGGVKATSFSGVLLWYSIIQDGIFTGNDNGKFVLDSNTGSLTLPNPLDYERDSNIYHLKIRAEETAISPRLHSDTNVKIYLRDSNDNPPEFVRQRYRDSLPESAPIGTTVLAVTARDRDSGTNGQFRYFVDSRYFSVDPYTGWISTREQLDYETSPRHAFLVVAQDSGIPAKNGTARVIVELTNVNDNKPVFTQSLYNVFIAENSGAGQIVATVQATDKDLDDVKYSILSGDNTTNFVIDSKTGEIRLVKNRRPELRGPYYVMNISATDGVHVSKASLVVAIEDINNHKPVFKDCDKYKPSVPEHSPARTFVLQVVAEDQDTGKNGEIEYSIETSRNSPYHFIIDRETGTVTTLQEFDREVKSQYQLHIIARDGGSKRHDAERLMGFCQVNVEITDKNDHPPVFQNKHYEATIGEDFDIGRSVLHVSANDKDAGSNAILSYSFNEASDFFDIDNATGTITTKVKLTGATRKFPLRVIALDNGTPPMKAQVDVTVTVFGDGNTPPTFDKVVYIAHVREDVPTSHKVIKVVARANNNQNVYYSIVPGNLPSTNNPKRFQIGTITGEIQTSHLLDYETTANYSLTIRAETSSNPPGINFATLKIYLEDVNDSPPEFRMPRYQGHVSENAPIGTSVIQVSASDLDKGENGRVTYRFIQRKSLRFFSLDQDSGVITTKKVFDRERRGRYPLAVMAQDHGSPFKRSTAMVEVIIKDENDNPPIFEQQEYNISIFEDVSIGSDVIKVSATDRDLGNNAKVSYQITEGNTGAVFHINRDFGTITIASSLDREKKGFYKLEITARDGENFGRATVHVKVRDVNDNDPKFEKQTYTKEIHEQMPEETVVLQLIATDPDEQLGGIFRFSISGQGVDAFKIDPVTGIIRTRKELDREEKARYDFLAFAVDAPGLASRRTGSADITIIILDINDNPPKFPDLPYIGHVQENLEPGASVMVITAVDNDDPNVNDNAKMTYELIYDADSVFEIDRTSGLIRTTKKLDRETKDVYILKVGATDGGKPPLNGKVNVTIMVNDANDRHPKFIHQVFMANVSEAADPGSTILTLQATDGDIGINAKLRYSIEKGNENREFRIEEETGKLLVAKSLDFETTRDYELEVKVRDSGVPSYSDKAEVFINVLDYNDNPPVFKPISYSASFEEDILVGTKLLQVTATDRDTAEHKEFRYSIAEGDAEGLFRIDPKTGELFLQNTLDREKKANHILSVRAANLETNANNKPMYGKASVSIDVVDVNDNGPHFKEYVLNPSIPENVPPPVEIVRLAATDPDSDPKNGGPFRYGIQSGNEAGLFRLTEDGILTSRAQFDREKQAVYELVIWGRDSGLTPMTNYTSLYVHIKDQNDHQHEGAHLDLSLNSYEGHFKGGHIGYVYVKDKDTDDDRHYDLIDSSSEFFAVDKMSGSVVSKPDPPEGTFKISVKVSDRYSGYKPVDCTVTIRVRRISNDAVRKSVAVRLRGNTREVFLKNYMISFKESVAEGLGTTKEYVDLFSVQNVTDHVKPIAIDVRFAVHGSPYYSPEKLIPILKANRRNLKPFNVVSIGVDPCQNEPCKYGSCRSELHAPGTVQVISLDGKSFSSIVVYNLAVCEECHAARKVTLTCKDKPCGHGGTCKDTPVGYVCDCPPKHNGKNCELTTRSFEEGQWIWLSPLRQCRASTLTLEFATRDPHGLILYAGPTSHVEVGQDDVYDFLAIELQGGRVYLSMSLGNRNDVLRMGVEHSFGLNDGKWHHLDIYRNETSVRMTVDQCRTSVIKEGYFNPDPSENRSMCEVQGRLRKQNKKFLNLKGPLQLGGISRRDMMYPTVNNKDFAGCIRNLINDGVLYDLSNPSNQKGSQVGCPVIDKHCMASPCHETSTCIASWTGYKCKCPVGQHGHTCWGMTEPFNYQNQSMTQYLFSNTFKYDPRETKIDLRIRTRDQDGGVLLHSVGSESESGEYSSLTVVREKPNSKGQSRLIVVYSFNLGDGEAVVRSNVDIGDGKWVTIKVNRYRNTATLTVLKDGVNYENTGSTRGKHNLLTLDPIHTYIGGIPLSLDNAAPRRHRRTGNSKINKDFVGCIDDLRFHGYRLLLNESADFGTALSKGVAKGCMSISCIASACTVTEWCYDAWRKHVCYPRMCASDPCKNGGTCVEGVGQIGENKFHCKCTPEYQGTLCETGRAVVSLRPDIGFENGLIIGLSLLLVTLIISACIVIMYIKRSRRDSYNLTVEEVFKRDNVADYHIDGGVEEDVDERFGDYVDSYDGDRDHFCLPTGGRTKLLDPCGESRSDRGYGGSTDTSPTFILLRPVMSARKSSPSPSAKSSEDEFYDGGDFHYGRAVAVDLTNKAPKGKRRSDPTDIKGRESGQRRSPTRKLNITLNPLASSKKPGKAKESRENDVKPRNGTSSKNGDKVESVELSSSDEGFASPNTSPPSSQDDTPGCSLLPRPIKVEIPLKHRNKSPKESKRNPKESAKTPLKRSPDTDVVIRDDVPCPPDKSMDAGSDPDEVSTPPDKVTSPGEIDHPLRDCPSPSIKLHQDAPPNDTSCSKAQAAKPMEIQERKFQNDITDIPDDFPPPYDSGHSNIPEDFPPPPKEAYAYVKDPKTSKRPKNPISTLPHPSKYLPRDSLEKFNYEGGGSPSGSLSSLGSAAGDDVTWESVNECGDRFRKLAGIYGMPPSVSFNPHDEIIQ